jgi:hypothetical protein
MRTLLACLLVLACLSCAPRRESLLVRQPDPTTIPDWPVGPSFTTQLGHRVWIASSLAQNPAEVAIILSGVDATCSVFQQLEGVTVPPQNVGVQDHLGWHFDDTEFGDANPDYMSTLAGCWCGPCTVMIYVGQWPLYHEFCHDVYGLWTHTDPRWPVWNIRSTYTGAPVVAALAALPEGN